MSPQRKAPISLSLIIPLIILLLLVGCTTGKKSTIYSPAAQQASHSQNQTESTTMAPAQGYPTSTVPLTTPKASGNYRYNQGDTPKISSIQMFNQNEGWAVSDAPDSNQHILRTEDGGHTWYDRTPPEDPGTSQVAKQVLPYFLSPKETWAVFKSDPSYFSSRESIHVWSTRDGGLTWSISRPLVNHGLPGEMAEPRYLDFINSKVGWIAVSHDPGAGQAPISIFQTTDGGQTWRLVRSALDATASSLDTCCQSGMIFLDEKTGLITNLYGPISTPFFNMTSDGGKTWQTVDLPLPEERLADAGYCGTTSPLALPPDRLYVVVQCLDPDSQTGKSLAYLYQTSDYGNTWNILPLPDPYFDENIWTSNQRTVQIMFFDPLNGWVTITDRYQAGDTGLSQATTHLFSTQDGGINWDQKANADWQGVVSFINLDIGWAAVFSPEQTVSSLLATQSSGKSWQDFHPSIVLP